MFVCLNAHKESLTQIRSQRHSLLCADSPTLRALMHTHTCVCSCLPSTCHLFFACCAGVTGSQAFAAWDAGYDVWLGNSRCNAPRLHQGVCVLLTLCLLVSHLCVSMCVCICTSLSGPHLRSNKHVTYECVPTSTHIHTHPQIHARPPLVCPTGATAATS